jgi:hypothetical protein
LLLSDVATEVHGWMYPSGDQPHSPASSAQERTVDPDQQRTIIASDDSEYRLVSELKEYWSPLFTEKQFRTWLAIQEEAGKIRTKRPISKKTGKPIPNRLLIHRSNLLDCIEQLKAAGNQSMEPSGINAVVVAAIQKGAAQVKQGIKAEKPIPTGKVRSALPIALPEE